MTLERAYLLGLMVGGGTISNQTFKINLPFKQWGEDPRRMRTIAFDILRRLSDIFHNAYDIRINYTIGNGVWTLEPVGNIDIQPIIDDLTELGLPTVDELIQRADLQIARSAFRQLESENFLTGIFDTRASIVASHRRFIETAPVVSMEIPSGQNGFKLVVQLCSWLTAMGCITDQILFNHPNQHVTLDPTYAAWKKGFKIRFLVRSFLARNSFALEAKAVDISHIEQSQTANEQSPCQLRRITNRQVHPITIHEEQHSSSLPDNIRDKLFLHYFHFCATLRCPFAPVEEVNNIVRNYFNYVSFFPLLMKGDTHEIRSYYANIVSTWYDRETILEERVFVSDLLQNLNSYNKLNSGLAYLFSNELNGKRHRGSQEAIIQQALDQELIVHSIDAGENEPICLINEINDRAIICSSIQGLKNQELIRNRLRLNLPEICFDVGN